MRRVKPGLIVALLLGSIFVQPATSQAQAQRPRRVFGIPFDRELPDSEKTLRGRKLFVTDRQMTLRLTKSKEYLRENRFAEGLRLLQSILDHSEDLLFNDENRKQAHWHTLKIEALNEIAGLPPKGREAYELQYGGTAQQMLLAAEKDRDVAAYEEVARRFFHTKSGYEATYLLGTLYLDRSEPLAAALCFERLRKLAHVSQRWEPMLSLKMAVCFSRAGQSEHAVRTLLEWKQQSKRNNVMLGGKLVEFFDRSKDALPWLESVLGEHNELGLPKEITWLVFGGNASRNASCAHASPVWDADWEQPTIQRPDADNSEMLFEAETQLKQLETEFQRGGLLTLPASHPLLVLDVNLKNRHTNERDGLVDLAVFRTLSNLRAVNLGTGELAWEQFMFDPSFVETVEQSASPTMTRGRREFRSRISYLSQRSWRDMTWGTLSSDGRFVFTLEELGFVGPYRQLQRWRQPAPAPSPSNKLMAFDLATGKLRWETGGPRGNFELEQAGTFFLGPPLPLDRRLFCLAENSGEITLLVLDAMTGQQLWSQSLMQPEQGVQISPLRRMSGISPSYGEGVLICPTSAGGIVAVDLARRLLLWGYLYPTNQVASPHTFRVPVRGLMEHARQSANDDQDRWIDSVPIIANGSVLLTPRDSDELHCLSLVDGSLQWKRPRDQELYLAAVHDDHVVMVGRTQVQALRLSDGEPVWKESTPIPMPTGRGFRTDNFYHLPLSTAEVATIDLRTGRIVARSKSRSGRVPGNLVAAGGTVVSQTIDSLVGYRPLDLLNEQIADGLKEPAGEAAALSLRGETLLHRGEEDRGLADLKWAVELNNDSRARDLMAATLLEGLRLDFAKYRTRSEVLEHLDLSPPQRSQYLRLHAAGLEEIGEPHAAFREYVKFSRPDTGAAQLERVRGSLLVRSDRWVRPRAAEIYENGSPQERSQMEALVEQELEQILQIDDQKRLQRFLNCFADLPIADSVRRALVERLESAESFLPLERHLQQLRRSEREAISGYATARLASLLLKSDRPEVAPELIRHLIDELGKQWGDIDCFNGKTGRELSEQWLADASVTKVLSRPPIWPERMLEAKRSTKRRTPRTSYPVTIVGLAGPFFEDWSLRLDDQKQHLIGRDGSGVARWKLRIAASKQSGGTNFGNYARVHDHLLAVLLGSRLLVIDTATADQIPKILWERGLHDGSSQLTAGRAFPVQRMPFVPARRFSTSPSSPSRTAGGLGPITDDYLCYQVGTNLHAVDPLTGQVYWKRSGIDRGSELFGDRENLFAVAPHSQIATVLRVSDGARLTKVALPESGTRLGTFGRHMLSWDKGEQDTRLSYTDVFTGNLVWEKAFSNQARVSVIDGDEVAILEPEGRFLVLSLQDGTARVESKVEPAIRLRHFAVHRSRERYILLTYVLGQNGNRNMRGRAPIYDSRVNGFVYGFDRATGQRLWSRQVENQIVDIQQPRALPVLIFTNLKRSPFRTRRGASKSNRNPTILIFDARTGSVVYRSPGSEYVNRNFECTVDAEKKMIDINFGSISIALAMTDKPLTPPKEDSSIESEANAGDDAESNGVSKSEAKSRDGR